MLNYYVCAITVLYILFTSLVNYQSIYNFFYNNYKGLMYDLW